MAPLSRTAPAVKTGGWQGRGGPGGPLPRPAGCRGPGGARQGWPGPPTQPGVESKLKPFPPEQCRDGPKHFVEKDGARVVSFEGFGPQSFADQIQPSAVSAAAAGMSVRQQKAAAQAGAFPSLLHLNDASSAPDAAPSGWRRSARQTEKQRSDRPAAVSQLLDPRAQAAGCYCNAYGRFFLNSVLAYANVFSFTVWENGCVCVDTYLRLQK